MHRTRIRPAAGAAEGRGQGPRLQRADGAAFAAEVRRAACRQTPLRLTRLASAATALRDLRAFVVKDSRFARATDGTTEIPRQARDDGSRGKSGQTLSHLVKPSPTLKFKGIREIRGYPHPTQYGLIRPNTALNVFGRTMENHENSAEVVSGERIAHEEAASWCQSLPGTMFGCSFGKITQPGGHT